jgi:hypothetical protein
VSWAICLAIEGLMLVFACGLKAVRAGSACELMSLINSR